MFFAESQIKKLKGDISRKNSFVENVKINFQKLLAICMHKPLPAEDKQKKQMTTELDRGISLQSNSVVALSSPVLMFVKVRILLVDLEVKQW